MTGEDLLEQRRARAGQADDEYRFVRRVPLAVEKSRAAFREHGVDAGGGVGPVVGAEPPLDLVARRVSFEGLVVGPGVLERLAEREREVELVRTVLFQRGQPRAHRLDLLGAEAEGLEVGEAPPGLAGFGIGVDGPEVGFRGFGTLAAIA